MPVTQHRTHTFQLLLSASDQPFGVYQIGEV
jgi:hypothetical protein